MIVRVVARVHGDDGRGRTAGWEHVNENEVDVVNPVEGRVGRDIEALVGEEGDASAGGCEVGV